jgi:hypothetical protein
MKIAIMWCRIGTATIHDGAQPRAAREEPIVRTEKTWEVEVLDAELPVIKKFLRGLEDDGGFFVVRGF